MDRHRGCRCLGGWNPPYGEGLSSGRDRGGWKTDGPRCRGRPAHGSAVRAEGVVGDGAAGADARAHASTPGPPAPVADVGAAGCPEHHEPAHGGGVGGWGDGRLVRSLINKPTSDVREARSWRVVTRCAQPPATAGGASQASARNDRIAPAVEENGCWNGRILVIRRTLAGCARLPIRIGFGEAGRHRGRRTGGSSSSSCHGQFAARRAALVVSAPGRGVSPAWRADGCPSWSSRTSDCSSSAGLNR